MSTVRSKLPVTKGICYEQFELRRSLLTKNRSYIVIDSIFGARLTYLDPGKVPHAIYKSVQASLDESICSLRDGILICNGLS